MILSILSTLLIIIPLLGILPIILIPKRYASLICSNLIHTVALLTMGTEFFVSVLMLAAFNEFDTTNTLIKLNLLIYPYIANSNISLPLQYSPLDIIDFGIDGVSVLFIFISTLVGFSALLLAPITIEKTKKFCIYYLLLMSSLIGIFASLNEIMFLLFWYLALLSTYLLVKQYSKSTDLKLARKLNLWFQFSSMLIICVAIGIGYVQAKTYISPEAASTALNTLNLKLLLFWTSIIAFAIPMGLFPFHLWLKHISTLAPSAISAIIITSIPTLGAFGMIRFSYSLLPEISTLLATKLLLSYISVLTILYAVCVAFKQKHTRKLISYIAMSQMGFVLLGFSSLTIEGINGAIFQIAVRSIACTAAILLTEIIESHCEKYCGRYKEAYNYDTELTLKALSQHPTLNRLYFMICLTTIGFPPSALFFSQFLIIAGTFKFRPNIAIIAICAILFLNLSNKKLLPLPTTEFAYIDTDDDKNYQLSDAISIILLLILSILFGLLPAGLMHIYIASTQELI